MFVLVVSLSLVLDPTKPSYTIAGLRGIMATMSNDFALVSWGGQLGLGSWNGMGWELKVPYHSVSLGSAA